MANTFKDTIFALTVLFKGLILIASFYFIYQHLFVKNDFRVFSYAIKNSLTGFNNILLFSLVVVMMMVNWILESIKWKLLISRIHFHTLYKAVQSVFAGLTFGMFTPNRIGELAGRIIFLKKEERINGLILATISGFSQLLFTIIFGAIGLFFLVTSNAVLLPGNINGKWAVVVLTLTILVVFLFRKIIDRVIKKYISESYLKTMTQFKRAEIFWILFMSVGRYLVFFLQFFILLKIFKVEIGFMDALIIIPANFFVISAVPSFAIADIGIRGAVSIFFLGLVSSNSAGILASSLALWFINLAIPAILGNVVILKYRLSPDIA